MKINIFLFDVKNDISNKNKKLIRKIVLEHAKIAAKKLGIDLLNIVIYPNQKLTITRVGSGGFAPNSDWIRLSINPLYNEERVENIIKKIIPLSVYHEMNHVARWKNTGYGSTLMEVIISEGLAIVFAEECWKLFDAPRRRYKNNEIKRYLDILNKRDKKKDGSYNHAEWFFGKGKPNWLGYKLGAYIIRHIRQKYPEINMRDLVCMDADQIIRLWVRSSS